MIRKIRIFAQVIYMYPRRKMNKTISSYIQQNIKYPLLIEDVPAQDLGMIIVMPCHNEGNVVASVKSIYQSNRPSCSVELLVVIYGSDTDSESVEIQNQKSYEELHALSDLPEWFSLFVIMNNNFSSQRSGPGLARKIGMDDAVRRFDHMSRYDGVIICFDADAECDENYLTEIESAFQNSEISSVGIHMGCRIEGGTAGEETPKTYPSEGSCLCCKVEAYCAVGGMNQLKEKEVFNFLGKLAKYGVHHELNSK